MCPLYHAGGGVASSPVRVDQAESLVIEEVREDEHFEALARRQSLHTVDSAKDGFEVTVDGAPAAAKGFVGQARRVGGFGGVTVEVHDCLLVCVHYTMGAGRLHVTRCDPARR